MRGRRAALAAITVILALTGGGIAAATTPHAEEPAVASDALAAAAPSFSDIGPNDTFYADVTWLASSGITTGWTDGTFRPTAPVTREAVAAFMYRWLRHTAAIPACTGATRIFSDVDADNPFCAAIEFMQGLHLTTGFTDGTFHPSDPVTREGLTAMLIRVFDISGTCPTGARIFSDVTATSPFCGYIEASYAMRIARGWPDGTFRPGLPVERQAVAAWLHGADTILANRKDAPGLQLAPAVLAAVPALG